LRNPKKKVDHNLKNTGKAGSFLYYNNEQFGRLKYPVLHMRTQRYSKGSKMAAVLFHTNASSVQDVGFDSASHMLRCLLVMGTRFTTSLFVAALN